MEHLRPVLSGRCSTWSSFIEVRGSPATIDYFGRRLVLRGNVAGAAILEHLRLALRGRCRQHLEHLHRGPRKSGDDWSPLPLGTALGAPPARFAWQAQHLEQLQARFEWQVQHLEQLQARFVWQVQHLEHLHRGPITFLGAASFCVARAALGVPPARFAWQAQHSPQARFEWQVHHLEHLHRGPRKLITLGARRSTWSTSGSSCVASGVALGAPQARFEWQVQHLEQLHRGPRKSGDD